MQEQNLHQLKEIQKQTKSIESQVLELAKSNVLMQSQFGLQLNTRKKDIMSFFQFKRFNSSVKKDQCFLRVHNKGHRAHKITIMYDDTHDPNIQCELEKKHLYIENKGEMVVILKEIKPGSISILQKHVKFYLTFDDEDNNTYQQEVSGLIENLDVKAPKENF